jgi:hypothetical protein
MNRLCSLAVILVLLSSGSASRADVKPPSPRRGAGTVPIWNPHRPAPGNPSLTVRVLVLNYDPLVPAEANRRLSQVFNWNNPAKLATDYKDAMEYASGGYLRFEIAEWRNLNEVYAQSDGKRYTIEEYVRNRRESKGWREGADRADYPRLLHEQHVAPLVDDGLVDEVWIFSDHFFGLFEASMAGPGAFFINGGVYPEVPSRRPFAFYGFNYERSVAEMMHDASHRTEATLNRAFGQWNLKDPQNNWEKFSANEKQSLGVAGVGTCHWPANAQTDYDYGNPRVVSSWADSFLAYPKLQLTRKLVSRNTWSRGPDHHLDYMKWYFAHVPRAAGVNKDGHQNNWFKYIFDFQSYDATGQPLPAAAELYATQVPDPNTTTHTLRVAYRSANQIDPASLGNGDLSVTGPDGSPLGVKLAGGNEAGGRTYRVAFYEVAAPAGKWEQAPPGEYVVTLRPDHIRTRTGTALPGGRLGSFRVGNGGVGIVTLEVPESLLLGGRGVARAAGRTESGPSRDLTREVAWTSSDQEVVSVDATGTLRAGRVGQVRLMARLGRLTAGRTVRVVDPGLPEARLVRAPVDVTRPGTGTMTAVIAFDSPAGIRRDGVGLGSVRVAGPNGFSQFPELIALRSSGAGRGVVATYRITPPAGKWSEADAGVYTIEVKAFQVIDVKGNCAPEMVLGHFRVRPATEPK